MPGPYADVVTFTTHKALRGPRGAMILCTQEHAKAIDKAVFPMMQGGPLEHCIAGKAVALKEASMPEFREYAKRTVRDARALAAGLADEGMRIVSGGTDSHLILADVRPLGHRRQDGRGRCDEVGIALNKNQIPYDPNPPSQPLGDPGGHAGPRDPGHGRARDAGDREHHRGRADGVPRTRASRRRPRQRVRDLMQRFPVYP